MANRNSYTSASPAFTGAQFADDQAEKNDVFFNNISLIPTVVTNSGNDYTLTIDPPLKTGTDVTAGMSFFLIPNAANTGNVRARITASNPYYTVRKSDGTDLAAGEWNTQTAYHIVFVSGGFRIMNSISSQVLSGLVNEQVFNGSGTWTKPLNMPTTALVEVQLWAGGGGGGFNGGSGGGGGAYNTRTFKISDLPATVAVTIGAGGNANAPGGSSSFGSLLSAFGGGGGTTGGGQGAGGGGVTSVGANGGASGGNGGAGSGGGTNGTGTTPGVGLSGGGGGGNSAGNVAGSAIYGGGGGAGAGGGTGGSSFYGGGGGASLGSAVGVSQMGGNGGNASTAATAPGGGGAGTVSGGAVANNNGAAGRCIVRVII